MTNPSYFQYYGWPRGHVGLNSVCDAESVSPSVLISEPRADETRVPSFKLRYNMIICSC